MLKISDIKYWFMYRFHPKHKYHIIYTGLKPAYYDIDHIMLHGMMKLLCRYVEDESHGEHVLEANVKDYRACNLTNQANTDALALEIYHWWKYEYPKEQSALYYDYSYDKDEAEEAKVNEMLTKLVSIRRCLWT